MPGGKPKPLKHRNAGVTGAPSPHFRLHPWAVDAVQLDLLPGAPGRVFPGPDPFGRGALLRLRAAVRGTAAAKALPGGHGWALTSCNVFSRRKRWQRKRRA
jgi:hypothetical protein